MLSCCADDRTPGVIKGDHEKSIDEIIDAIPVAPLPGPPAGDSQPGSSDSASRRVQFEPLEELEAAAVETTDSLRQRVAELEAHVHQVELDYFYSNSKLVLVRIF